MQKIRNQNSCGKSNNSSTSDIINDLNQFITNEKYRGLTINIFKKLKLHYKYKSSKQDITNFISTFSNLYRQFMGGFKKISNEYITTEIENSYFIYLLKLSIVRGYATSKAFTIWETFGPKSTTEINDLFIVDINFNKADENLKEFKFSLNKSEAQDTISSEIYDFWYDLFELMIKQNLIKLNTTILQGEHSEMMINWINEAVDLKIKKKIVDSNFKIKENNAKFQKLYRKVANSD